MRRAALLLVAFVLVLSGTASARPIPPDPKPPPPPPLAPPPSGGTGGGLLGSPDMTQGLGGADANCSHLQGASATVIQNCASSGLAESAYPPSSFQTDTHVDTGLTDPAGDLASIAQEVIGGIYSLLAHVLTWILLGLGLAFNFDLFASDKHGQIPHGLATAERLFTFPLIPVVLLVGAAVGIAYWFGQRSEGRAVVHWGGMVALMIAGLIIAQNPVAVLGWIDQMANGMSSGSLAAFSGQGGGTSAGFANAVPGMYKTTMEEPWCSMEFGNVSWCMATIDPQMAAARRSVLLHLDQALGDQGTTQLAQQQAPLERLRLADAKTNGELFLSFIPNSDARNGQNDNWTLYHALLNDQPQLASIRTSGGVWERFGILFLAAVAGVFFLVLLLYIAWQLIVASVFFVLGLLLAPVAVLAPAFGEAGRNVFLRWIMMMLEALAKKVIFAIYLGVILLVTNVFLSIGSSLGGWLIEWLILAGIWAMALVERHKILDVMTAGFYKPHQHPGHHLRAAATAYAWKRTPQRVQTAHQHFHDGNTETHQHVHIDGFETARPAPAYVQNRAENGRPDVIEGRVRELRE